MTTEPIDIRVYNGAGNIDATLSGVISIYNQTTASFDVSNVAIPFSAILGTYHYDFITYDEANSYVGMVDFGPTAPMRYASFSLQGANGLTALQSTQLEKASKTLTVPKFIALQNP